MSGKILTPSPQYVAVLGKFGTSFEDDTMGEGSAEDEPTAEILTCSVMHQAALMMTWSKQLLMLDWKLKGWSSGTPKNELNPKMKFFYNDQSSNDQTTNDQAIPDGKMIERRKRASCRCGCNAQLRIKRIAGSKYMVYKFVEKHNHCLGPLEVKMIKDLYGVFENKEPLQLIVKIFIRRGLIISLNTCTDENTSLVGLFWADKTAKRNYAAFGDVVSFDATFHSNRYNMVLVPFTGIDNHNRCVSFGVALLASESSKKYTWLLQIFQKVFGNAPKVVVTDQDPAMRLAIVKNFPDTRHRLCMWHIMQKLTNKVGTEICSNTDFKRRLCNIVWTDKIERQTFDKKWAAIMDEFSLNENKWLSDMFEMRDRWIPAYFHNEPMSGFMRTTSRRRLNSSLIELLCFECTEVKYEVNCVPSEGISKVHNYHQELSAKGMVQKCYAHKRPVVTVEVWMQWLEKAKSDIPNPPVMNKNHMYASLLGVTEPEEVTIHLPNGIRNKGTGRDKRYVSKSEIASHNPHKPKRLCRNCRKYVHHDSRNCPDKKKSQDNEDLAMEDIEEDA
ncbi:FAR1-related sequence 5-like protein [Tanacetum coccineum]